MSDPDKGRRQTGPMSDETKMGLLLSAIAFLAYGAYALMFFSGMLGMAH
jgi:hypothetical protein